VIDHRSGEVGETRSPDARRARRRLGPRPDRLRAAAYHEAGHAVVNILLERPVNRATIRGETGSRGHVERWSRHSLLANLTGDTYTPLARGDAPPRGKEGKPLPRDRSRQWKQYQTELEVMTLLAGEIARLSSPVPRENTWSTLVSGSWKKRSLTTM